MGEIEKTWLTPHKIYEYFATGRGTDLLDDAQNATRTEWDLEEGRAQLIRKQGELIRGGWQGAASDGAFGAAQPLAESALHGADLLSRGEDLLDRQSGSFHRAANSVKPMSSEPPKMDIADPMVVFSDYDQQVTSYQADAQHNMQVYGVYDGASEYNEKNAPTYSTVSDQSGMNISVTPADTKGGEKSDYIEVPDHEQPRDGGVSEPYGDPGDPGSVPTGGPPISEPPISEPPISEPTPGSRVPQQTTPSDYVPPSFNTPGYLPPTTTQPTPTGPTPGGFVPGLPVGFTNGPGGGTGGPGMRGGTYGPGAGPGSGPGATERGPAGVRGAGPAAGAIAAEEAAAARRAAAAAAARGTGQGMMGGAPVGAGRGKGDEDDEHKRKVLIEADAEGVFGSDVLTAPQVIGDDEYEDD